MMKCEKCGSCNTDVFDTRLRKDDTIRWRRRACKDCGHRWSTVEVPLKGDDIEHIVKCKNCKHMLLCVNGMRFCRVWNSMNGAGDDGYCNYGEARERSNIDG